MRGRLRLLNLDKIEPLSDQYDRSITTDNIALTILF